MGGKQGLLRQTWGFLVAMCGKMLNFAGQKLKTNGISKKL
jgi:hypothetical protein